MPGSSKRSWLKPLSRRTRQPIRTRRLKVTRLEERDNPGAFTAGDLVIYRVGDGTAALGGTGTKIFLDEYSPAGTLVQSIDVTTPAGMVATGNSTTEGILNLSQDGSHLIFTGYASTVNGTTNVAANNRIIETADASGALTALYNLPSNNAALAGTTTTLRSADAVTGTSNDAGVYLISSGSVGYVPSAITGSVVVDARNSRQVFLANNTVYASNASTAVQTKIQSYGTLPTALTAGTNIAPTATFFPSADAVNGFAVLDLSPGVAGPDTVYYLDTTQGKLGKFTFDGTNWNDNGSVTSSATDLTAVVSGSNVTLYLTNTTTLSTFTDSSGYGGALTGSPTMIITAPTNTGFRGIQSVPKSAVGTGATTVTVSPSQSTVPVGTAITFTATVTAASGSIAPTGTVAFKYNGSTFGVGSLSQIGSTNSSQAQFQYSGLPIGNNEVITAAYGGDVNFAANSNTTTVTVTGSATTTTVTSDGQQETVGQTVKFTATVLATSGTSTPVGSVVFYDDGLPLNSTPINVSGTGTTATAQLTVSTNAIQAAQKLTPGSHTITAIFTPQPGFTGGNGTLVQYIKANPFTAGDMLLYRVGDGTSTLSATGNVVFLDEYNPSTANQATPIQSIVMPSFSTAGGNQALITSAQQSTEGQLTLSADGQWLYLTGYDSPLGGGVTLNGASATSIPRTIGRIRYDGFIDTSMALTDLASGGSVRGVTSPDGVQFYATGSTGGVRYVPSYTAGLQTSTQVDSGANGTNGYTGAVPWTNLVIFAGQLYGTDNISVTPGPANTVKVATIGTGLPTTAGNTVQILPGLPTTVGTSSGSLDQSAPNSPYGVFFAHLQTGPVTGPDTMYVADQGPSAQFFGGDITKWSLVSGSWVRNSIILSNGTDQTSTFPSFNQINGVVNGSTANLFVTYGNGGSPTGPGYLWGLTDTGGYNLAIPNTTLTTLASVPVGSNLTYRGVAPVPQAVTTPVTIPNGGILANDGSAQRSEVRSISITFSGPVTFAGTGTVNQNAAAAFELDHINDLSSHFATPRPVGLTASVSTNGSGNTVVTLTFSGAETDAFSTSGTGGLPIAGPSLADGRYVLTAFANKISGPGGGQFNGGSNYVTPTDTVSSQPSKLYRIFGDQTGDGINDASDLNFFRAAFNTNSSNSGYLQSLDGNNDGVIDASDLLSGTADGYRPRFNGNVYHD
jgi:hypothetical protein